MKNNLVTVVLVIVALVAGFLVGKGRISPPIHAVLSVQEGTTCQQSLDGIPTPLPTLSKGGGGIVWSGTSATTPITVTFTGSGPTGPFQNSQYSQNISTGAPTGPPNQYSFSSVTIGTTVCSNPQAMGVQVTR